MGLAAKTLAKRAPWEAKLQAEGVAVEAGAPPRVVVPVSAGVALIGVALLGDECELQPMSSKAATAAMKKRRRTVTLIQVCRSSVSNIAFIVLPAQHDWPTRSRRLGYEFGARVTPPPIAAERLRLR